MSWKVADAMTREVVAVRPETSFKDCVEMIGVHRVGALPVTDGSGRLLGIVTESDLLRKEALKDGPAGGRATARLASEAMTRAMVTVPPDTGIAEAARLMYQASVRHLPVVDAGGRLLGIVARADLLSVFLRSDESIRREIDEELLPLTFGIPRGSLEIDVRDGIVHLAGDVEESLERLLPAFVERVEGVGGVVARLSAAAPVTPA
jgi:CBS domain-containing protein